MSLLAHERDMSKVQLFERCNSISILNYQPIVILVCAMQNSKTCQFQVLTYRYK